jgi:hypothetical protein
MGFTVHVDRAIVLIIKYTGEQSGEVYLADPAHGTGVVKVQLEKLVAGSKHKRRRNDRRLLGHAGSELHVGARHYNDSGRTKGVILVDFELPIGGMAGSGVTKKFTCDWCH